MSNNNYTKEPILDVNKYLDSSQECVNILNMVDIIKASSYMFYEFRDETLSLPYSSLSNAALYEKLVSPVFCSSIVENQSHTKFLDLAFEELPLYHLRVTSPRFAKDIHLSDTRDPAIADVPTFLHTDDNWNTWFRESQGSVHNDLLLNVYNKLKHPFIDENQYLNAGLLTRLSEELYTESRPDTDTDYNLIEFKSTLQDNTSDINNGDEGCLDFLEDIINQKIQSCYAMLDYKPDQSLLLDTWSDSLYWSGRLHVDNLEKEKTIYKLQDISYELLRRKFAGSTTLYTIALSCIDRSGSFINATTVGDINTEESYKFRDSRLARLINLPGIITEANPEIIKIDPLKAFNTYPLEKGEASIDLKLLSPMYFSSANIQYEEGTSTLNVAYSAEDFYLRDSYYRANFLRDRTKTINWNTPESIIDKDALTVTYPKLDTSKASTEQALRLYLKLDGIYEDISNTTINCESPEHEQAGCVAVGNAIIHNPIHLDIKQDLLRDSATLSSLLDVNADDILYHKNTIQQQLGNSYPYITYPIANSNSLSLMDTFWINYLDSSTARKSRVQDKISFGTQISNFFELNRVQTSTRIVFTLEKVDSNDSKLILYKNTIYFNTPVTTSDSVNDYKVVKNRKDIISIINLATGYDKALEAYKKFSEHDSFDIINTLSVGILPFTYSAEEIEVGSITADGSLVESYKIGVYDQEVVYDQLEDHELSKAIFVFSKIDNNKTLFKSYVANTSSENIEKSTEINTIAEDIREKIQRTHSAFVTDLSKTDISDIKAIYYILPRYDSYGNVDLYWSSPINVIVGPLEIQEASNSTETYTYHPDWYDMCYQLNPQLNFEAESASPLRRKDVFKAPFTFIKDKYYEILHGINPLIPANDEGGPSPRAALCNLARLRGYEFLCNDLGESDTDSIIVPAYSEKLDIQSNSTRTIHKHQPWVDADKNTKASAENLGFYLDRIYSVPSLKASKDEPYIEYFEEPVSIYGDNRFITYFDNQSDPVGTMSNAYVDRLLLNSSQLVNLSEAYCLRFHRNVASDTSGNRPADVTETVEENGKIKTTTYSVIKSVDSSLCITNKVGGDYLPDYFTKEAEANNGFSIFLHYRFSEQLGEKLYADESKLYYGSGSTSDNNIGYIGTRATLLDNGKFCLYADFSDTASTSNNNVENIPNNSYKLTLDIDNNPIFSSEKFSLSTDSFRLGIVLDVKLKKLYVRINNRDTVKCEIISLTDEAFKSVVKNAISIGTPFSKNTEKPYENVFYGCIYDLRLYSRPVSPLELQIYNNGTLRELYSTSPSVYSLANYVYTDESGNIGILKQNTAENPSDYSLGIDKIRLFNRSVWDSIIPDTFPVLSREYDSNSIFYHYDFDKAEEQDIDIYKLESSTSKVADYELHDAIQQDLAPTAEITNNTAPLADDTTIIFQDQYKLINAQDKLSIVTTTLHPSTYSDAGFISEGYLTVRSSNGGHAIYSSEVQPIELPIDTVGNSLVYKADLNLNFQMEDKIIFDSFYDAGSNIIRLLDEDRISIGIKNDTANGRGTGNNYILLPLTLPAKTASGLEDTEILDRFALDNLTLNSVFNELLSAKNYYTEFRLPIAMEGYITDTSSSSYPYYINKWTGIRTLKEGSYFITCKYPLQIMPFEDNIFNANDSKSFTIYYGTVRFRIDVKGKPVTYNKDKYSIDGYPDRYKSESLKQYLEVHGVENPSDNRSFPHREMEINLYAMGKQLVSDPVVKYEYTWELVASNRSDIPADVVKLDKQQLSKNIKLKKPVYMYLSNNYSMPFFVANLANGSYNSKHAVDDTTSITVAYTSLYKEHITATKESDLNNQVLYAGRSYKLLFDYDAKLTEFSFSENTTLVNDKDTSSTKGIAIIDDDERSEYAKLHNLLLNSNSSLHTSSPNITEFFRNNTSQINYLGGYYIDPETINYSDVDKYDIGTEDTKVEIQAFGNPYSKSSLKNYLLSSIPSWRSTINDSTLIPYVIEDKKLGDTKTIDWGYLEKVQGISIKNNKRRFQYEVPKLSEYSLLQYHVTNIRNIILDTIANLSKSTAGIISSIYSLDPCVYDKNLRWLSDTHKIGSVSNDLLHYRAAERTNIITNRFSVTRASLYTNNLLYEQDFTNISRWSGSIAGSYVVSETAKKDMFTVTLNSSTPYFLVWKPSSNSLITNDYEIAVNCSANINVHVAFLTEQSATAEYVAKLDSSVWEKLNQESVNGNLAVYSTEFTKKSAVTVAFKFEANSDESKVSISSIFARIRYINTDKHGLYNATVPYKEELKLITKPHSIMLFRNKETFNVLPIQFKSIFELNRIKHFNVDEAFEKYILNPVATSSNQSNVIPPWRRLLVYKEKEYNDYTGFDSKATSSAAYIYAYVAEKNEKSNKYVEAIQPGNTSDIYRIIPGTDGSIDHVITYNDSDGIISINGIELVSPSEVPSSIINRSNLMFITNMEDSYLSISLANEKVSGITNCFNIERYLKKETSLTAVTNIQYLDKDEHLLYEIEYLPIIYDESIHHLSINTIFRKAYSSSLG